MRISISLPRVSIIKIEDRGVLRAIPWVKGNPRGIAVYCFEIRRPREGSEIQTTNRGEGENRGWTAVCKIIGWNEGNRTESACDRQPQMPDTTRSLSRSRRPIYVRPAWPESPSARPCSSEIIATPPIVSRQHVGLATIPIQPIRDSVRHNRVIRIIRGRAPWNTGPWDVEKFRISGLTFRVNSGHGFELSDFPS